MLYASTVATLKREFGLTYITEEIRATSIVIYFENKTSFDVIRSQAAPPPMTMREEEMNEIKQREVR
jgi:hypothetical protein